MSFNRTFVPARMWKSPWMHVFYDTFVHLRTGSVPLRTLVEPPRTCSGRAQMPANTVADANRNTQERFVNDGSFVPLRKQQNQQMHVFYNAFCSPSYPHTV